MLLRALFASAKKFEASYALRPYAAIQAKKCFLIPLPNGTNRAVAQPALEKTTCPQLLHLQHNDV